jgi:large subunit ribosomal protein L6
MLNQKMLVAKFCARYFNMSRVAKNPIEIVDGVTVNVTDKLIEVKGKVGEIKFDLPDTISLEVSENIISVKYDEDSQQSVALAGTTRAIVNNMIVGVSQGFEKKLELKGVGYRAKASGKLLELTLGFSHPVKYQLPEEVQVETPSQTEVVLKSHNKQILGQAAAEIRAFRPPEPYKGKGVRYSDETVRRKEAKKAAGA